MKIVNWVKKHQLVTVLLLVLAYLLAKDSLVSQSSSLRYKTAMDQAPPGLGGVELPTSGGLGTDKEAAPQPDVGDRKVVQTSQISAVVDDVSKTQDQILDKVEEIGGYMVSSSLRRPEEQPFGQLVVRVPADKLDQALSYVENLAVKVSSQNLIGRDVTDQYEDLEEKLRMLNKSKQKYESLLDQASEVNDILKVQRELINLQNRIDNIKGRQEYLDKTAQNAKLTIYLSSDELSLPYVPEDEVFRPKVVFKKAVRSLVKTIRSVAKAVIWLGVYSLIIIPVVGLVVYLKKKK